MLDVPEGTAARLETIKQGAASFRVEDALSPHNKSAVRHLWNSYHAIRGILRERKYAAIHTQGRLQSIVSTMARQPRGPEVVHTVHLAPAAEAALSPSQLVAHTCLGRFLGNRVIAISEEVAQRVVNQWRVPANRIRRIPHGINVQAFDNISPSERSAARNRLGISEQSFVICQLARLVPIKRPETLVRAAARLRQQARDVVVLLAGDAEVEVVQSVQALAHELGVTHMLRMPGHLPARLAFAAADVNVLASEREGFPISVIEAMAAKRVTIRTSVEGAREQIQDQVDGFLFELDDHVTLAKRIALLMDNPSLRAALESQAYSKACSLFSDDVMTRKTIEVYEELCRDGQPW
jgi:glycosyltransferase involved in cell wall biosynthesis